MNTLKGVFDNDRPACKRNFIVENVRQLRSMQKSSNKKEKNDQLPRMSNKFKHIVAKVPAHVMSSSTSKRKDVPSFQTLERARSDGVPMRMSISSTIPSAQSANHESGQSGQRMWTKSAPVRKSRIHPISAGNQSCALESEISNKASNHGALLSEKNVDMVSERLSALSLSRSPEDLKKRDNVCRAVSENSISISPVRSLGCQTVCPEDVEGILNEGVIKYPSTCNLSTVWAEPSSKSVQPRPPTNDSAQQTEGFLQVPMLFSEANTMFSSPVPVDNAMPLNSGLQNVHYVPPSVHERLLQRFKDKNADKHQSASATPKRNSSLKKGQSREKHLNGLQDPSLDACETHLQSQQAAAAMLPGEQVPLPEVERLETLRILQKSYEDHIRQLNSLPVKTDTLRMRLRKIDIEKQLDKLEEGIKVFSRPKVFVKIGV